MTKKEMLIGHHRTKGTVMGAGLKKPSVGYDLPSKEIKNLSL